MGNRYKKLVDIEGVKWSKECPVLLLKGALLHDDAKEENLLQLKFQSITNDTLVGMEIEYKAYSMGDELLLEERFSYLDLNVNLNDEFGEKTAIYLQNSDVRKFSFSVKKVFFVNGEIWENTEILKDIESQHSIKTALGDLYNQFQREYKAMSSHENAEYLPVMEDCSWQCTCGSLNLGTFDTCRCCRIAKKKLLAILDREYLLEANEKFEAEEKRQCEIEERRKNEERIEKIERFKKYKKRIFVSLLCMVFLGTAIMLAWQVLGKPMKYKNCACELIQAEKYKQANHKFLEVFENLDVEYVQVRYYEECLRQIEKKNVDNFLYCFKMIHEKEYLQKEELNYALLEWEKELVEQELWENGKQIKDCIYKKYNEQYEEIFYNKINNMFANGDFVKAIEKCYPEISDEKKDNLESILYDEFEKCIQNDYKKIEEYNDVKSYMGEKNVISLHKKIYDNAKIALKNNENDMALAYFKALGDYKKAKAYVSFLNLVFSDDVTKKVEKLPKINLPEAKRYLKNDYAINFYKKHLLGFKGVGENWWSEGDEKIDEYMELEIHSKSIIVCTGNAFVSGHIYYDGGWYYLYSDRRIEDRRCNIVVIKHDKISVETVSWYSDENKPITVKRGKKF